MSDTTALEPAVTLPGTGRPGIGGGGTPPICHDAAMAGHDEWRIDRGLAFDLAAAIGWAPSSGVPGLVAALVASVPQGSTAKLAAVAAGEVPPGADPAGLAAAIAGRVAAGRPLPSYTCWAFVTLTAALARTLDVARPTVVATRNEGAVGIDFHGAVLLEEPGRRWLCDPYFAALVPGPGDDEVEHEHLGVWTYRSDGDPAGGGRWRYWLANPRWSRRLHFRLFAPELDRSDVHAFCAISVEHSGLPRRRGARLWRPEAVTDAWARDDGGAVDVRHLVSGAGEPGAALWGGRLTAVAVPTWPDACLELRRLTGVAVE